MKDRYYQTEAHEKTIDFLLNRKGNPAIELPGGAGKTVNIAKFVKHFVGEWGANTLIITHTKELVRQNWGLACKYWPEGRRFYGINSASLGCRDYNKKAIFGTINSVYKDAKLFPKINCLIIDEVHRVQIGEDAGMYQRLVRELKEINPKMRIIGLSAQMYRMDAGRIYGYTRHHIINEIVHRVPICELVANKYLSPLINKASLVKPDVSGVPLSGKGEFIENELEDVVIDSGLVKAQVNEIEKYIGDRKKALVFCVTIKHAIMVNNELKGKGHKTVQIDHTLSKEERDKCFESFGSGGSRFMINVRIATEGYDNKRIDFIADLAPTNSQGLYMQKGCRGSRVEEATCHCGTVSNDLLPCSDCGEEIIRFKINCFVLDCAGNINRHGSIDELDSDFSTVPDKIKKFKKCPTCFEYISTHLRACPFCKHVFVAQEQQRKSSGKDISSIPILSVPVWMDVDKIQVSKSTKNPRTHIVANFYCAGGIKLFQNIELKNPSPEEKWAVDIHQKPTSGTEYCRMKLDRFALKPRKVKVLSDRNNLKIIGVG